MVQPVIPPRALQGYLLLVLLLFVAVFAGAAHGIPVPYPILLTIVGGILGVLSIFPSIALDPNIVFYVFLPPLLFAAGWQLIMYLTTFSGFEIPELNSAAIDSNG